MAQQNDIFVNLSEDSAVINKKELRISVTHNTQRDSYFVSIREYITSDRYTGYNKSNGLTIPVPDEETGFILANTIATAMKQTGNLWGSTD